MESVKTLLEDGAKVNPLVDGGMTPLDIAVRFQRQEVADFLRGKGGITRVEDEEEAT